MLSLSFSPSITTNYDVIKLYALNTEVNFYHCWIESGIVNQDARCNAY